MTDPITDNFLHKVSNKPILLVGPTASGKSKLAMSLAIKLKRHIVNADSLQVYSNWRILTARPTSEDEKIIQHHLYGTKHLTKSIPLDIGCGIIRNSKN